MVDKRFDYQTAPSGDFGYLTAEQDYAAAVDFVREAAEKQRGQFAASAFCGELDKIRAAAARAALHDFFYKRALAALEKHAADNGFKNAWNAHCVKTGRIPNPVKQWEGFI